MHNQRGFMGCGGVVIIFWLSCMLAFGGFIIVKKNLFHMPPEKHVLTSPVAAKRGRQKLEMFKNNQYIKNVILNELELNSILNDEFAHGRYRPITSVKVKMEPGKLEVECMVIFRNLFLQKIRAKVLPESNKEKAEKSPRRVIVNLGCQPIIEEDGNLFVNPTKLIIGRQRIPMFVIKMINAINPDWFNYPVSEEISSINIYEQELEIIKDGVNDD